jgi:oligopeptide transport system ATP-binding protein
MENLLEVKNLVISFFTQDGEVKAVRDVSFSLAKGEVLGIVGESGSGKSVTSMAILRLLTPTERILNGEILFNGKNIIETRQSELRKIRGNNIAMVFQDPMSSLNPLKPIGKQIDEALKLHTTLSQAEIKQKTIQMLELVKIPEAQKHYHSYPHEFSGGMRQRVMIAMALICNPSLVIADEPTTALDVTIQDQILKLLRSLRQTTDSSIIFISHDLAVIASLCERVIVMYGGMIMEEASITELFDSPSHPYTIGLLNSIPAINQDKSERLEPIPGSPPDMLKPPEGCPFSPRCVHARAICGKKVSPYTQISATHKSMCWLLSDDAPAVGNIFKEKGQPDA